nr:MAG TPA: hypothetical protein [Caudoviricetes sp.]
MNYFYFFITGYCRKKYRILRRKAMIFFRITLNLSSYDLYYYKSLFR